MMADVRLIDANSLKEIQIYALVDDKSIENGISFAPITCVLKEDIDNAPTINKCDNCDLMFKEKTRGNGNDSISGDDSIESENKEE